MNRQELQAEAQRRWASRRVGPRTEARAARSRRSSNTCSWVCWVDVHPLCPGTVVWYADDSVIPCSCRCHRPVR